VFAVIVEKGTKRVFASAAEWPGWARSGKTEAEALESLAAYGPRYAKAAKGVMPAFVAPKDASAFEIVQRLAGGSGTDFGVPSSEARADDERLAKSDVARLLAILEGSWAAFDRAARAAEGKTLRVGPRGGGRSVEKMTAHVLEAEVAYLSKLGSRAPKVEGSAALMRAVRRTIVAAFEARALGKPLADPANTKTLWTPRYFARRSAWHALDHAWELEDRVMR
jgi:hypothetical protein